MSVVGRQRPYVRAMKRGRGVQLTSMNELFQRLSDRSHVRQVSSLKNICMYGECVRGDKHALKRVGKYDVWAGRRKKARECV